MPEFIVALPDSLRTFTQMERGLFFAATPGPVGAEVAIQAAIDDLPPEGGIVRIMAGEYTLNRVSGQDYCVNIAKGNLKILMEPGAVLKLADNQADAGESLDMIVVTHTTGTVEAFTLWGPGTIDYNRDNNAGVAANLTLSNRAISVVGNPTDVLIGGGMTFRNVVGVAIDVDGSPSFSGARTKINGVIVRDCGEGIQVRNTNDAIMNNFFVFDMNRQDGVEIVSVPNFVIANGVVRNTNDECIDISAFSQAIDKGLISNVILGPRIAGAPAQSVVGIGGDGSTALISNVVMSNFTINMGNASAGIDIGGALSAGVAGTKGVTIGPGVIDGALTAALSNPLGIILAGPNAGGPAVRTLLVGVQINDCNNGAASAAIGLGGTKPGDPDDITIVGCTGWNNVAGIVAGTGAQNNTSGNFFQADT